MDRAVARPVPSKIPVLLALQFFIAVEMICQPTSYEISVVYWPGSFSAIETSFNKRIITCAGDGDRSSCPGIQMTKVVGHFLKAFVGVRSHPIARRVLNVLVKQEVIFVMND